jgi:hypothetical protein
MNSYHAHRLYSRALGSKNRVPKLISQDSAGGYIRDSASPNYSGVDIQTIDQVGNWYIFVWDGINSVCQIPGSPAQVLLRESHDERESRVRGYTGIVVI